MTIRNFSKKFVSYLMKKRLSVILYFKIIRILFNVKKTAPLWIPSYKEKSNYRKLWNGYKSIANYHWLRVYGSISGIRSANYIPENIYYSEIEPRLNNKTFSKAYTSKNFYHLFLNSDILPEVVLRTINGVFYDSGYVSKGKTFNVELWTKELISGKYIIKPSVETGGGSGVRILEISSEKISLNPDLPGVSSLNELARYYRQDFIIQKYLEQHPYFSQFNHTSLNTVRILTYRSLKDEKINILHRILRMGRSGSVVDNQASGGIACGIKPEGFLSDFGVDKYGNKHYGANGIIFSSVGKVRFLEEISELAITVAGKYLYSRLLGLDFGVDKAGKAYLIEVNDSNNEINFYQMNNGPLFGDFTDEISKLGLLEPKSVLIDYYLD